MTKEEYKIILEAAEAFDILHTVECQLVGDYDYNDNTILDKIDWLYEVLCTHQKDELRPVEVVSVTELQKICSSNRSLDEKAELLSNNIACDYLDDKSYQRICNAYNAIPKVESMLKLLIGKDIPEISDNIICNKLRLLEPLILKYKDHTN